MHLDCQIEKIFFAFTYYVGALWCPPMTWAFCEHNLKDIKVKQLPGMQEVVFDQCRYGLVSLESKKVDQEANGVCHELPGYHQGVLWQTLHRGS